MSRMSMTKWHGRADWNVELESGAPAQRFTPLDRPIDLLDEEAAVHRPTPTVHSIAVDAGEDVGRYLPLGLDAVPVAEVEPFISRGAGAGSALYDPAQDAFLAGPGIGDAHAQGPAGGAFVELEPADLVSSDDDVVTSAADAEDIVGTFIALPHYEAFALPTTEGIDVFGDYGRAATFGGGDDPLWMLTQLPSPDDHINDAGSGHPGLDFDIWG